MDRPERNEYNPYFNSYIDLVESNNLITALGENLAKSRSLLASIPEEKGDYRYAPGKWSIKEVLSHIIDTERVFGYRALTFAREKEAVNLPGYDHDHYATVARASERTLAEMAAELEAVRNSSIYLFKSLDPSLYIKGGKANGNEMTVRALGYVIAGHEIHHLNVVKERYI